MKAKKSAKNNKGNAQKIKGILVIAAGFALLVLLVAVAVSYVLSERKSGGAEGSFVSLGTLEYDFSSGRAVKRTDAHVASLRSFLEAKGEKNVGENCKSVYHNVVAASPDEKQVLLSYGCTHPNIGMFAVHENGEWKTISPTNQFNEFGVPRCEHVDTHVIDSSIAPVCVNQSLDGTSRQGYEVR